MSGLGLGMVVDQLADLKLGELLDTPPPGLDEAVAIAKVRAAPARMLRHSALLRGNHIIHPVATQAAFVCYECLGAFSPAASLAPNLVAAITCKSTNTWP